MRWQVSAVEAISYFYHLYELPMVILAFTHATVTVLISLSYGSIDSIVAIQA
jgi:hypothetical protein